MIRRVSPLWALLLVFFASEALAQATAESALTHSLSGAAGAKTGSSLGKSLSNALDKSAQKLSDAVQPSTPQQAPATEQATPATPAASSGLEVQAAAPGDASLVQLSMNESGTYCPAPLDWHQKPVQPAPNTKVTVCSLHAEPGPFPKTKYKPVVDIKF